MISVLLYMFLLVLFILFTTIKNEYSLGFSIILISLGTILLGVVLSIIQYSNYQTVISSERVFYFYIDRIKASFYDIKRIINIGITGYFVGLLIFCVAQSSRKEFKIYNIASGIIITVVFGAFLILNSGWFGEQLFLWRYSEMTFYNNLSFYIEAFLEIFNYCLILFFSLLPFALLAGTYKKTQFLMKKSNIRINALCLTIIEINFVLIAFFTPLFEIINNVCIYDFTLSNYSFSKAGRSFTSFFAVISMTFIYYVLLKYNFFDTYIFNTKKRLSDTDITVGDLRHVFHTFKNYAMIITTLALKAEQEFEDSGKMDSLQKIKETANELAEQTGVFIDINNGMLQQMERVNLLECINSALSRLQYTDTVKTELKVLTENIFINGAQSSIIEMCYNILQNAEDAVIKKKTTDGKIIVSVFEEDNYVCISFWDNGCGMERRIKRDIFKPFVSTNRTFNHWGLGMSHARSVVKSHYGYIDVESKLGCFTEIQVVFVKYL